MNDQEILIDEFGEEKIPVNDKRRFNADGEMIIEGEKSGEPVRSAAEIALEAKLKTETERREAAESKLGSVQVKFEEAKANLEKETAEMRARLMKTLEDRGKQAQFNFLTTLLPVLDNLNLAVAFQTAIQRCGDLLELHRFLPTKCHGAGSLAGHLPRDLTSSSEVLLRATDLLDVLRRGIHQTGNTGRHGCARGYDPHFHATELCAVVSGLHFCTRAFRHGRTAQRRTSL